MHTCAYFSYRNYRGNTLNMHEKLARIQEQALAEISRAPSLTELENKRVHYLGRKGAITEVLRALANLAPEQRRDVGQAANEAKARLQQALDARKDILQAQENSARADRDRLDLSLPGRRPRRGHMHIVSQVTDEIVGIFKELGFQVAAGPDIETEYYNFDSLNIPANHPARDVHDTFFVKPGVVLRTHTSPVQMRVMERVQPPVAIVAPGRVYRNDYDASHSPMFHQIEGLLVDEGVSFADLKGTLMLFVHRFFGPEIKLRFRPHYFPFTEPSAEMDISCAACRGDGCRFCKRSGWVEILGCGMVNPRVFEYANYDTEKYTGYAFGFGIDRIATIRHGVASLNYLFENDLRFLEQF
jgi:phenylalanyl-tRNA synthetase alpha chain